MTNFEFEKMFCELWTNVTFDIFSRCWYFSECLIDFSRMFDEICEVREVQRNVDWTHVEWIDLEKS